MNFIPAPRRSRPPATNSATNSANHPGNGITLRQNRSSSHIIACKASAARQWNSRQRRKLIENHSFERHQLQYFIKFSIFELFRFHGTTPWSTSAPSLQIRFAIWCDQSKAIAEKTSGKIRLDQTNSQISRISGLNTRGVQKRFFMSIWPKHPGTGITLTANRSTNHMKIMHVGAARQWNSRQRRKFIENDSFRPHQRQLVGPSAWPRVGCEALSNSDLRHYVSKRN